MRRVTRKPPNMLTAVSERATASPRISVLGRSAAPAASSGGAIWISAPIAMIDEIALVTLISGVYSDGVTFQITM